MTESIAIADTTGASAPGHTEIVPDAKRSADIIQFPRVNDAVVYGDLDDALLDRQIELAVSPAGTNTKPGRWRKMETSVRDMLTKLSTHEAGEKEGSAFVAGALVDGDRKASAVKSMDLLVLDVDVGQDMDALRGRIQALGLFALIHTSHSHLKPVTSIKKDAVAKHCGVDDLFELESFLLDVDGDGDRGTRSSGAGRTHRCPNDDNHSNSGDEEDRGFYCANAVESETGKAVAHCMHDSCAQLDRIDFIDLICEREGITSADGLMKWVPELVDETNGQPATGSVEVYLTVQEASAAIDGYDASDTAAGLAVGKKLAASLFGSVDMEPLRKRLSAKSKIRACRQLSQMTLAARWTAARKLRAVLS